MKNDVLKLITVLKFNATSSPDMNIKNSSLNKMTFDPQVLCNESTKQTDFFASKQYDSRRSGLPSVLRVFRKGNVASEATSLAENPQNLFVRVRLTLQKKKWNYQF